jgi:uncharacterized protein YjbI with pentapeptide repeats
MADKHLLDFLLNVLSDPAGRKKWLDLKHKSRLVDLASADFTERDFRDYDFSEAVLSTAILLGVDASGADFSDAELSYADLRRATLRNACLDRANLHSANLQGARLTDANLESANLAGARLMEADMVGADLSGADLRGADLRRASLKYTRLTGALLEGADVAEADLTGTVMDDDAPRLLLNFERAIIDDRKYRVMKSRLTGPEGFSVEPAEADKIEGTLSRIKSKLKEMESALRTEGGPSSEVVDYVATRTDLETETGCYRILGIEHGTPLAGITKAFRQKAKKFHPDKTGHLGPSEQEAAREQFELARQAYEKLSRAMAKPMTHLAWVEGIPVRESPYDYTIEEYVRLAEANLKNADVLYNLGWKYFEAGLMDEALDTYERVLALNPLDEDAEYNVRIVRVCKTFEISPESAIEGY